MGTECPDQTDSCFPVSRMPMGLVEYIANFFVAEDINMVAVLPAVFVIHQPTMG